MPRKTNKTSTSRQDKASVFSQFSALIIVAIILGTAVTIVYISPILFPKNATLSGIMTVTDVNGNILPASNQINLQSIYTPTASGEITDAISLIPQINVTGGYASATTWSVKCGLALSFDGTISSYYSCGAVGGGQIPTSILLGTIALTGAKLNQLLTDASSGTHTIAFLATGGNLTISIASCTQCGQTVTWTPKTLDTLTVTVP